MTLLKRITSSTPPNWSICASILGVYIEPFFLSILLLTDFLNKKIYQTKILTLIILILLHGIVMSFFTGYSLMMTFSQSLLLLITLIGYKQLYLRTGNDLKLWFDVYFKYAFFIAWIGIVDFLYFVIVGHSLFVMTLDLQESVHDIPRLKSIMLEPGYVVTFLAPAVTCIFIKNGFFKYNKIKSLTIVLAFCLTLSTSMLMTFFIILLVKFYIFFKKYFLIYN